MEPQQGTSSGCQGQPLVVEEEPFEVDISLLVGEDEAPQFRELLQLNSLKLVPCDWTRRDPAEKHMQDQLKALKKTLSEREAALEERNIKLAEKETASDMFQNMVKQMQETERANQAEIEELTRKLEESEEEREKVQMDAVNQQGFYDEILQQSQREMQNATAKCTEIKKECEEREKTVKKVQSQLKQAKNQISTEKAINEKILEDKVDMEKAFEEEKALLEQRLQEEEGKVITNLNLFQHEKATLERRLEQDRANLLNQFQDERATLERQSQEEKRMLENKFQDDRIRRMIEISAMKDEIERLKGNQCKYMGFLRSFMDRNGLPVATEDDFLSGSVIERLSGHLQSLVDKNAEDAAELQRLTRNQTQFIEFVCQLKDSTGFPMENELDLLSTNLLENLSSHVKKLLETNTKDRDELTKNRLLLRQLQDVFLANRTGTSLSEGGGTGTPLEMANGNYITSELDDEGVLPSASPPTNSNDHTPSPTSESLMSVTPPASPPPILITSVFTTHAPAPEEDISYSILKTSISPPPSPQPPHLVTPKTEPDDPPPSGPPSIVIPLLPTVLKQSSSQIASSLPSSETVQKGQRHNAEGAKQSRRNPKQFTPYFQTSKRHGINKASSRFRCYCGKVYALEKGLKVHIRRMTTEWKHRCQKCKQYFFYQHELKRHMENTYCAENATGGSQSPENNNSRPEPSTSLPPQQQQYQPPPAIPSTSSSIVTDNRLKCRISRRKLQQDILKRKTHAPWLSKQGTVQGSWYCKCGSKFSSKSSLHSHIHYFTLEWKFKCKHCSQKFFCLSYLKKHLIQNHKIANPMAKYTAGCYLCAKMFHMRKQLFQHRRVAHNLYHHPNRQNGRNKTTSSRSAVTYSSSKPVETEPKTPSKPVATSADVELIDVPSDDEEVTILPDPPKASSPTTSRRPAPRSYYREQEQRHRRHAPMDPDPLSQSSYTNDQERIHHCKCKKKYKSRQALMRHIKIKEYGRIFTCLRCDQNFKDFSSLKDHTIKVHRKDLHGFRCRMCKMLFSSGKVFANHIQEQHPLDNSLQEKNRREKFTKQKKIML